MWKIAHEKHINTHRNSDFTAHNIRYSTKDIDNQTSTSPRRDVCIVEHLILLHSMLITFCLFSEFARNSFFFYLKCACSVNNTASLHYTKSHTNNVTKTWALLQTTGGKYETNIVSTAEIVTDVTTRNAERKDI
jgi:hypothetical protein